MSIIKKFRLSVLIIIVVPMILIFSVIFYRSYSELKSKMIENSRISMKQAERSIKSIVEETQYLSLSMLIDDNIQKLCKQYTLKNSTMDSAKRQLYVSMQDAVNSKSYIDSISISYNSEVLFQYGNKVEKEDGMFEKQAMEIGGRAFWTRAYRLQYREKTADPHYVISYIRAFMDVSRFNQPIGLQRISINEKELSQTYASLAPDDQSEAFLVGPDGCILSALNETLIGRDLRAAFPGFEQVLNDDNGYFGTKVNQVGVLVIYQDVEGTDWKLVQAVPRRTLLNSSGSLFLFMLLALLLLIIFSVIFSAIQNHTIIHPIYRLSKELSQVKDGNFDIQVNSNCRDEIGCLTEAFEEMLKRTKELINRVYLSRIQEKESAFKALEAQINPHFLYNVLDSIHWAAIKQKDWEVSDRIEALSELFRHVLNKGDSITTMRAEVNYLQNYLFLQKNKFAGKICVCIDVEEELMECQTLKLILQPLVENAIQHGLAEKDGTGNISVWIERKDGSLFLHVEDDGCGADEDAVRSMIYAEQETGGAFALKNIHDRVRMRYGEPYGLTFESLEQVGTVVTVRIPELREGADENETDDCG
ncbi:sensor histidine kinase [Diplocloster modestus]|uniref:Sensor histidine kinase n=1 Tax=Diplocloster modestus TaxID=2850322 RepID=A0ABS6K1R9_9FIRM|nr:sensor histidine kinase [Diplocloster modestus]MBU9724798.1 sensor histidine kinase [Diplocloster modestus]